MPFLPQLPIRRKVHLCSPCSYANIRQQRRSRLAKSSTHVLPVAPLRLPCLRSTTALLLDGSSYANAVQPRWCSHARSHAPRTPTWHRVPTRPNRVMLTATTLPRNRVNSTPRTTFKMARQRLPTTRLPMRLLLLRLLRPRLRPLLPLRNRKSLPDLPPSRPSRRHQPARPQPLLSAHSWLTTPHHSSLVRGTERRLCRCRRQHLERRAIVPSQHEGRTTRWRLYGRQLRFAN